MGAWASGLQGIGGVGEDAAKGKVTLQQWRDQQAANRAAALESGLRLKQLQQQIAQGQQLQNIGSTTGQKGEQIVIQRDPNTGTISTKTVVPGFDATTAQEQADQLINSLPKEFQPTAKGLYRMYAGIGDPKSGFEALKGLADKLAIPSSAGSQSGQYTTADGKSGNGYRDAKTGTIYDAATGVPIQALSFTPAAEVPTSSSGVTFQSVGDQLVAIPTTKTGGKGASGKITVGKPIDVGTKGLTSAQALSDYRDTERYFQTQLSQAATALNQAKSQKSSHPFASKIPGYLGTDPDAATAQRDRAAKAYSYVLQHKQAVISGKEDMDDVTSAAQNILDGTAARQGPRISHPAPNVTVIE